MIDSLIIDNFRAYKHEELNFSPGVNVIVGASDGGKSTITNAINWLMNNRPTGTSFIRHNEEEASVQIKIKDNVITRKKGRKATTNSYVLNEDKYEGFNQDVPDSIKKCLRVSDVNTQFQFDGHFLLSKSGGEISRYLNKITNLEVMDSTLKNIQSSKRKTEQELELLTSQQGQLQEQLQNYKDLDVIEALVASGEVLEIELKDIDNKKEQLKAVINDITETIETLDSYREIKDEKELVTQGLDLLILWHEEKEKISILSNVINSIKDKKETQIRCSTKINNLHKKYEQLMPEECPLCGQEIK